MSATPPDRRAGRRALLRGFVTGIACYILTYVAVVITAVASSDPLILVLGTFATGGFISLVVLVTSIGQVIRPSTRAFGAGLMMAVAIGIIVGAGVCTAMVPVLAPVTTAAA